MYSKKMIKKWHNIFWQNSKVDLKYLGEKSPAPNCRTCTYYYVIHICTNFLVLSCFYISLYLQIVDSHYTIEIQNYYPKFNIQIHVVSLASPCITYVAFSTSVINYSFSSFTERKDIYYIL